MAPVPPVSSNTDLDPDVEFWQECRRRALELHVPAWQLAEERFTHRTVDTGSTDR
jgi:hypothetical protein